MLNLRLTEIDGMQLVYNLADSLVHNKNMRQFMPASEKQEPVVSSE